jgi:hypothetical protein
MRIIITLFPLFSFVQGVLDITADSIRHISVYKACFYLEPPKGPAKRVIRPIKSILFGLPQPTAFYRPILKNPDLQLE